MALTFVCQACFTRMQPVDASGVPVTKCSKCWSPNLKPEGMPGEPAAEGAPEGAPAAPPPVPPELIAMFERMFDEMTARLARDEHDAALDEAEEARRERMTVAATNAIEAVAELARAGTAYVKHLATVG